MAQQYTYLNKVCATCEYWGGARSFFDRLQQRVVVESTMVKGKCYNRSSGWFTDSAGRQACYRCQEYARWSLIRD